MDILKYTGKPELDKIIKESAEKGEVLMICLAQGTARDLEVNKNKARISSIISGGDGNDLTLPNVCSVSEILIGEMLCHLRLAAESHANYLINAGEMTLKPGTDPAEAAELFAKRLIAKMLERLTDRLVSGDGYPYADAEDAGCLLTEGKEADRHE